MISQIFAVHDVKANAYLPPFFMHNDELAKRTFSDCIMSEKHAFSHHPADYTLFHLGSFDDDTGVIITNNSHTSLGNGIEFIAHTSVQEEYDASQIGDESQLFQHPASGNP